MKQIKKKSTLRPSPTALLNPRCDVIFKAIFTQGTKESQIALKSFLSVVLGRKIKSATLEPNEPAVDIPDDIQMSFDVSVEFDNGEKAAIEMQGRDENYEYSHRAEIQVARLLTNNSKKGSDWNCEKVYQISVMNFHYPKDDKSQISHYTMKNEKGQFLGERLNIIFIDLLEIKKLFGTPIEQLTPLQKWGLYFAYADDETKTAYIQDIARSEEGLMEANYIVKYMSEEDANWFREFRRDKARRDYNTGMMNASKKGFEKGLKKGQKQGLAQGLAEGAAQKAVEDAVMLIKEYKEKPEVAAKKMNAPLDKVLEALKAK